MDRWREQSSRMPLGQFSESVTAVPMEVLDDRAALLARVADWLIDQIADSPEARGNAPGARVALALGSGPLLRQLYRMLAADPYVGRIPWDRLELFWTDELMAPHADPRSHFRQVEEALIDLAPLPRGRIHPIVTAGLARDGAEGLNLALRERYGSGRLDPDRPLFDVVLLDLGEDGAIASHYPGIAEPRESQTWVHVVADATPEARIVVTYPALCSCRGMAVLAAGDSRRAAVARALSGEPGHPATELAAAPGLVWFLDRAAVPDDRPAPGIVAAAPDAGGEIVVTDVGDRGDPIARAVVAVLQAQGRSFHVIGREGEGGRLQAHGLTWMAADLDRPGTVRAAIADARRLVLTTPAGPGLADQQRALVAAAQEAGVEQVVLISAADASEHGPSRLARAHWQAETALRRSGIGFTILRLGVLMQDALARVAPAVAASGRFQTPWEGARVALLDAMDVGAVVAGLLADGSHLGRTYTLTGGEAVAAADIADAISDVIGRPVFHEPADLDADQALLAEAGVDDWLREELKRLDIRIWAGEFQNPSPAVGELLGRPPATLRQFVQTYRALFGG